MPSVLITTNPPNGGFFVLEIFLIQTYILFMIRESTDPTVTSTSYNRKEEIQKIAVYGTVFALTSVNTALFGRDAIYTLEPGWIAMALICTGVTSFSGFQAARATWQVIYGQSPESQKASTQKRLLQEGQLLAAQMDAFSQKVAATSPETRYPLRKSLTSMYSTLGRMLNTAQGRSRPS